MKFECRMWVLMLELYKKKQLRVKWNNIISDKFHVLQGVRQEGVSYAPAYKCYPNCLLNNL